MLGDDEDFGGAGEIEQLDAVKEQHGDVLLRELFAAGCSPCDGAAGLASPANDRPTSPEAAVHQSRTPRRI